MRPAFVSPYLLLGLGALLFCPAVFGSDALTSLQDAYGTETSTVQAEHDQRMEQLVKRYEQKLSSLRMQMRKPEEKSELAEEVRRFDAARSCPSTSPKTMHRRIRDAQDYWRRTASRYQSMYQSRLKPAARRYDRGLRNLLRDYERAGDAENATAVRDALLEHGQLMFELGMGDRNAPVLVLVNQHNSKYGDRGSRVVNVVLSSEGQNVWERYGVEMKWSATSDPSTAVLLPKIPFDRVRITVTQREGVSAGFSEIKLMIKGKNIAPSAKVKVSGAHKFTPATFLTDGVENSDTMIKGYFCFPDKRNGWVELDVTGAMGSSSGLRRKPTLRSPTAPRRTEDGGLGGGAGM